MTGDHLEVAIDQDRDIEPERFDAVGDLPDLLLAVQPGVGRIRLQLLNPVVNDGHPRSDVRAQTRSAGPLHLRHSWGWNRCESIAPTTKTWPCNSRPPKS